jgi:ATP-dependent Clp protease ATP-binding subunit ClpA
VILRRRRSVERDVRREPAPVVIELFSAAQVEATALRHDVLGTEHVLLGLLTREDAAGRALRELGLGSAGVRDDVRRIAGEGPAPETVFDARALASVGVDLDAVRARAEATFGEGSLERARRRQGRCGGAAAFGVSPRLKLALESVRRAADERGDGVTAEDVLIGLAEQRDSVAARILSDHGVSASRISAALGDGRSEP